MSETRVLRVSNGSDPLFSGTRINLPGFDEKCVFKKGVIGGPA